MLVNLLKVGSNRCHDLSHNHCIMPQLGSSPISSLPGSGYYTVDDYREILTHAAERHITIIPEFDMPGHSHAAVNSMEVSCVGSTIENIALDNCVIIGQKNINIHYITFIELIKHVMSSAGKSFFNSFIYA